MEKVIAKIENFIESKITQFEAHPIKTSIELFIVYVILKKLYEKTK